MELNDILEMWKKDSVIDDNALDKASINGAILHGKYLEIYSVLKLQLKKREMEQQSLLKDKWLYYSGKMTKADMDKRSWPYDPFNGLKVLKADMDYFFNSDTDLQRQDNSVVYIKTMLEAVKEILEAVKWRHQTLKNCIEFKKFVSGN